MALAAGLHRHRVALGAVFHPGTVGGLKSEIVGDIHMTVGAAGPQIDVELMRHPDLEGVELEAHLIDALGHPLMAT
jgi:catabolite regulation protein CreA